MSLLPPDEDLELLHTRNYEVRVYHHGEDRILVRGAISDMKPAGLYVEGDPDPLEIHQMQVEWVVQLPELEIIDAGVVFETHPHPSCPGIVAHYEKLVGLKVARGFTHKIRELFGGPRGCTHTTALLQAMVPAVVQSTWSVSVKKARDEGLPEGAPDSESRARRILGNINTCHVWDEDGEHVAEIRSGRPYQPPMQVTERLVKLGRDPAEWTLG